MVHGTSHNMTTEERNNRSSVSQTRTSTKRPEDAKSRGLKTARTQVFATSPSVRGSRTRLKERRERAVFFTSLRQTETGHKIHQRHKPNGNQPAKTILTVQQQHVCHCLHVAPASSHHHYHDLRKEPCQNHDATRVVEFDQVLVRFGIVATSGF